MWVDPQPWSLRLRVVEVTGGSSVPALR